MILLFYKMIVITWSESIHVHIAKGIATYPRKKACGQIVLHTEDTGNAQHPVDDVICELFITKPSTRRSYTGWSFHGPGMCEIFINQAPV